MTSASKPALRLSTMQAVLLVLAGIDALFDNADEAVTMNQASKVF